MSETSQFIIDHQAQIDEAEFLSRLGRMNPDQREACCDKITEIYDRLIDAAPIGDGEE